MTPATAQPGQGPAQGLAILLWATGPDRPDLCAAPFMYAAAAAALDLQVEIHFAAASVELLVPGRAAALPSGQARSRSIADFMADAHAGGARFLACSAALHDRGLAQADLLPWVAGVAGATHFVARSVAPGWRALVF